MHIEPATCPACGAEYDPLRARAVTVIDGHVRAFCSVACRDRGIAPPATPPQPPTTDAHVVIAPPRRSKVPTEIVLLGAAAVAAVVLIIVLVNAGRQGRAIAAVPASSVAPARVQAKAPAADGEDAPEVWLKPLAGGGHRVTGHDRQLFSNARQGVPAKECAGARCAVDIEAAGGDVVMAVHDGVVERVERDADEDGRRGKEGRFIRIVHKGGELATSYLQLDGIREDLRPGIPVAAGEAIGTVARGSAGVHAHLRFAVSLPHARDGELYIDPQPLVALWPARPHGASSLHAMESAR
jgi:murein DD-endopeptidase MepM/ murein hydrolase activator NlpD